MNIDFSNFSQLLSVDSKALFDDFIGNAFYDIIILLLGGVGGFFTIKKNKKSLNDMKNYLIKNYIQNNTKIFGIGNNVTNITNLTNNNKNIISPITVTEKKDVHYDIYCEKCDAYLKSNDPHQIINKIYNNQEHIKKLLDDLSHHRNELKERNYHNRFSFYYKFLDLNDACGSVWNTDLIHPLACIPNKSKKNLQKTINDFKDWLLKIEDLLLEVKKEAAQPNYKNDGLIQMSTNDIENLANVSKDAIDENIALIQQYFDEYYPVAS